MCDFFFFKQRLEQVDPNVPSPGHSKRRLWYAGKLEVIREFLCQGRSGVYGFFEVGRPRLNDYVCLGEPFFIKLPVAYLLLLSFFRFFFRQQTAWENLSGFTFSKANWVGAYDLEFKRPRLNDYVSLGNSSSSSAPSRFFYWAIVCVCVCVWFFLLLKPRSVVTIRLHDVEHETKKKIK